MSYLYAMTLHDPHSVTKQLTNISFYINSALPSHLCSKHRQQIVNDDGKDATGQNAQSIWVAAVPGSEVCAQWHGVLWYFIRFHETIRRPQWIRI